MKMQRIKNELGSSITVLMGPGCSEPYIRLGFAMVCKSAALFRMPELWQIESFVARRTISPTPSSG